MNNLAERVTDLFQSQPFRTYKSKEIARQLKIPASEYAGFRTTLRALVRSGQVLKFDKNRYGLGRAAAEVVGKLFVKAQGYGFVVPDEGEDVFVSQKNMGLALHKDTVRVRLFAKSKGKTREGQIVGIIQRARQSIVGVFRTGRRYSYVIPDELKIQRDIVIGKGDEAGAIDGQKVVVEIDAWEHEAVNPFGHVVKVLGYPEEQGVDILSIIHGFELPTFFPKPALTEAERKSKTVSRKEIARRLDLRDTITFTIDPEDAKDFDDAISLQVLQNGNFRVGVHIADVSYYVREKTALDEEAFQRGTSVYLVDRVVPMLPEKISNEICSLVEKKDKLCFSVIMELTSSAHLVSYEIRETVINSKKRFTYNQVQEILEGKRKSEFSPVLRQMHKMSKMLIKKRRQRGSIDFESLELDIELDDKGIPIALRRRARLDAHRLVEEFMLLANETVAQHVGQVLLEKTGNPIPFIYRTHEKPDAASMNELITVANGFGVQVKQPKRVTPKFFQRLSEQFQASPASAILEDALLRAMMKAKYSPQNAGHFGLAYKFYTHFTSPIRRYPDLMVHRLLKLYLKNTDKLPVKEEALEEVCRHANECEVRAQEAERATMKLKQVEYLERHIGDVFDGIISRIVAFGLFVELPEFLVDGLVHVSTLAGDYYVFDESKYSLIGQYSGNTYRLGDHVKVQIVRVDRNERLIDFEIVRETRKTKKRK